MAIGRDSGEEYILALEVSMYNVDGVQVLQPSTYVHTQLLGGMR